jgi:hypothetical protein
MKASSVVLVLFHAYRRTDGRNNVSTLCAGVRKRQNKVTSTSIYAACAFRALDKSQFKLYFVTWPWNGMLFLFCISTIPETTRLPIQWIPTVLCPGLMEPGREPDHSSACSGERLLSLHAFMPCSGINCTCAFELATG